MRQIVTGCNGDDLCKRLLQLGVPLDRLRHGKVVEFMSEHNRTALVEGAVVKLIDEALIVPVDLLGGDRRIARVDPPIVGVGLPEDTRQVQCSRDGSDSIVDVAERRPPTELGSVTERVGYRADVP